MAKVKPTIKDFFIPYPDRKELYQTTDSQVFIHKAHADAHAKATKGEVKVLKNPKYPKK